MFIPSLLDLTEKKAKLTFFIFSGLIIFSIGLFVFAENNTASQTLFNDSDQDGLSNDEEKLYGTDPMNKDTDGDGYSDGIEVSSGYNPLKPAPGDKIISDEITKTSSQFTTEVTTVPLSGNLTEKASGEIANLIKDTKETGTDISMETINASVDKILEQNNTEVILPEIDIKDIKIKKISKKLSGGKRTEQEKEDVLEYLTVLSYLIANNSPKSFQKQSDFENILNQISTDSLMGLASGNTKALEDISTRGENILKELKDIEVPEDMVDIHIKALKMALYAMQLKQEIKPADTDPLGQIGVLARTQGFFVGVSELGNEIQQKLSDHGIEEIPLNL
ncbi:MAG: hypothetical protein COZ27_04280 [Candidatus Moranbacteria bacterium CG_4_10_14_3_um_filter_41_65]|nr:MAG: hypothetical protein COX32_02455 [Candidatus Moranbacteria bacterium CG23_combo_of_CG06-09_8_20_14_all_41_28]PIV86331.1 MAG: hypothetical protein COW50_01980 [Candidatus Moranbacteria bacterium CG17_big_fil_post_rev_8_21_14_2_50_41_107]PIW94066.1 MAG: hypothetical protein COZ86_02925 [Candidatus Moranbacteria bacterium CG_4_8_14_3_um_filter_41_13]PIX90963.1 MAG: hypothetical protein COZ27_04280 [Candidatus Moranbacteria bacterium CG_4_10_14_3_um_filter_41_65]